MVKGWVRGRVIVMVNMRVRVMDRYGWGKY